MSDQCFYECLFSGNRLKPSDPMPLTDWTGRPTMTHVSNQNRRTFGFWISTSMMIDLNVNGTTVFGRCVLLLIQKSTMVWLPSGWWPTCSMPVFPDNSLSSRILSLVLILRMAFLHSEIFQERRLYLWKWWWYMMYIKESWKADDKQSRMIQGARLLIPFQQSCAKALGHHEWGPVKQSLISLESPRSDS